MVNGTLINYYFFCKTKLWLHANRINLEDNSEDVCIGKIKGVYVKIFIQKR